MLLGIIKKKKEFAGTIAPVTVLFFFLILSEDLEEIIHVVYEFLIRVTDGYPEPWNFVKNIIGYWPVVLTTVL